jgi:hypothetical protein
MYVAIGQVQEYSAVSLSSCLHVSPLPFWLCVSLPVCLSVRLPMWLSTCIQSACLHVCLSAFYHSVFCLAVCLSAVCPFSHLIYCISITVLLIRQFVYQSVCIYYNKWTNNLEYCILHYSAIIGPLTMCENYVCSNQSNCAHYVTTQNLLIKSAEA